jgi:hypothetical protein
MGPYSWSWQTITAVYRVLSDRLKEYNEFHQRINIPHASIEYSDEENLLFLQFWRDVARLNSEIEVLDREIARRNKLIGVMG